MASFNGNIDLLALNGAKVFSGIDQERPNRAFICIPADINNIKVEQSRATDAQASSKLMAKLHVNIWPLNENYKAAARRSAQERGDINVNVPTHEMQQSFSTEYIKGYAIKNWPKLVQDVKDANKDRNPDIVNQDPLDENTHLFKAIRNRLNKRIAMLYQPQAQPQQQAYPQSFAQATGTPTAYVAPANGQESFDSASYMAEEELPF